MNYMRMSVQHRHGIHWLFQAEGGLMAVTVYPGIAKGIDFLQVHCLDVTVRPVFLNFLTVSTYMW